MTTISIIAGWELMDLHSCQEFTFYVMWYNVNSKLKS